MGANMDEEDGSMRKRKSVCVREIVEERVRA